MGVNANSMPHCYCEPPLQFSLNSYLTLPSFTIAFNYEYYYNHGKLFQHCYHFSVRAYRIPQKRKKKNMNLYANNSMWHLFFRFVLLQRWILNDYKLRCKWKIYIEYHLHTNGRHSFTTFCYKNVYFHFSLLFFSFVISILL